MEVGKITSLSGNNISFLSRQAPDDVNHGHDHCLTIATI